MRISGVSFLSDPIIQNLNRNVKNFAEKYNLGVGHGTTISFDICEVLGGNMTSQQIKFGGQFFMCPIPLATEFQNIMPNVIEFPFHDEAKSGGLDLNIGVEIFRYENTHDMHGVVLRRPLLELNQFGTNLE